MRTQVGQLIEGTKHGVVYPGLMMLDVGRVTGACSTGRWKITLQWKLEVAGGGILRERSIEYGCVPM
jgi:hypothetical protein